MSQYNVTIFALNSHAFFKREKSNLLSLLTYLPFPKDLNFHLVSLPFNLINFLQNVTAQNVG